MSVTRSLRAPAELPRAATEKRCACDHGKSLPKQLRNPTISATVILGSHASIAHRAHPESLLPCSTDPPAGRRSTDPAFGAVPRLNEWQIDSLFVTKMLAMALLLHGGLLGGMGGEAAGVDGSGEGAWTLATPAEGFLAASGAGELAHLLHLN